MAVTDLQKCKHIINKYGNVVEREVADKLRSLHWNGHRNAEEYMALEAIADNYLLDTANKIYADNKDNHEGEWFMIGND